MKNCLHIEVILVFILTCFLIISGYDATLLDLEEGFVCQEGEGNSSDYVCKRPENCSSLEQDIKRHNFPPICSFIGNKPVVCCSPEDDYNNNGTDHISNEMNQPAAALSFAVKPVASSSYSAVEMCRQYSELAYTNKQYSGLVSGSTAVPVLNCHNVLALIVGGSEAKPKEFPHMALLGYNGKTDEEKTWGCGGSLISNRWIMSAAHCANNSGKAVSWACLGDVNIYSASNSAGLRTYEIVESVVHPNYHPSYVYNDIGLFRLGTDAVFSAFVRPICLNTDQSLYFKTASATGWGRIKSSGPTSPDLLRVDLRPIPIDQCKYSYPPSSNPRINLGILEDRMICAGDFKDGNDTCTGDSGGPLQIRNTNYPCMYDQIGITSFGKYCGSKHTPGVYTRVSHYVQWIERIVWPRS